MAEILDAIMGLVEVNRGGIRLLSVPLALVRMNALRENPE